MKYKLLLLAISLAFNTQIILAQVPSNIPTNGLIGYWPFNGNANDESGNGNNGKVFGAVLATDRFGNENKSYFFSGKDWIEINSLSQINNSKELSISIWVKSTGLNSSPSYGDGGSQYYFSRGDFGNNGFVMSTIQGSSPHFSGTIHSPSMFDNPRIIGIEINSPVKFNIPHTQWHHLLMIYNGVSVNYYVDGVLSVSSKYDKNIGVSTSPSVFGKQFYLNDECYVVGMIDDAAIWNRALTDEEIGNLFSFDSNKISNVINSSTNNNLNSEKPDKNTISISKDLENKGTLQTDISKNYLDYQKNVNYKPILGYMISVNGCKVSRVNPDVNSVTWSGLCKDSLANGNGILKYYTSEKETFSYEGDVLNGIFYGYGKCTYTNGDKYEGEFKDNKSNGYGTYYSSGKIHKGQFKGGKRDGQGTTIYQDGDNFVGEWKDDKANGKGKYTYSNGSAFTGVWSDGNLVVGTKKIVLVENSKQKVLAENSKQETSQTKNLEAFAAFMRSGNSSNSSTKPNNSSRNAQTPNQKCFDCRGTGQCSDCSKPQVVRYKKGEIPRNHNEIRLGMVICPQCGGNLMNWGTNEKESCYLCKKWSGWVLCRKCNSNGDGRSLGKCQKCKGTGYRN